MLTWKRQTKVNNVSFFRKYSQKKLSFFLLPLVNHDLKKNPLNAFKKGLNFKINSMHQLIKNIIINIHQMTIKVK